MSPDDAPAYGLWLLVIVNAAVFIIFAFSFAKPRTTRDWRSFGAFSAFIVALFTEMYGFPLTIYLLSGWLMRQSPGVDLFAHNSGHLWETLLGTQGDPHFSVLHLMSNGFIFGGFILLSAAWKVLYAAQRTQTVALTGPYAYIRHPQYVGFILIMVGFLLQWPTLVTLLMFPILLTMYVRLARREEREALAEFGDVYASYAAATPPFLPRLPLQSEHPRGAHAEEQSTMRKEHNDVHPI
jgi:protein-S-isoprenylcysteine O-methyltransferase Ste14